MIRDGFAEKAVSVGFFLGGLLFVPNQNPDWGCVRYGGLGAEEGENGGEGEESDFHWDD